MKILKKYLINVTFCVVLCFSAVSCVSNKLIPIPGEDSAILNNLYVEYANIGDTYYRLEEYGKAATYYEMAMKNRKLYWSSYYKLAKCYALQSDWNRALPMYEKILKRDPENSTIKSSLAYIYVMQGEIKKANKIYNELLAVEPENQSYIENYIAVLMPDKDHYDENKEVISIYLDKLKNNFPENQNLKKFDNMIEKYEKIDEPEEKKSDSSDSDNGFNPFFPKTGDIFQRRLEKQ